MTTIDSELLETLVFSISDTSTWSEGAEEVLLSDTVNGRTAHEIARE